MAIMTPRGLKVRLPVDLAFTLIARLWDRDRRVDAFRVLKTCEAIHSVPAMLGYCAGIGTAAGPTLPWSVVPAILAGRVAGEVFIRSPLVYLPGLIPLARLWSYISGYGVFLSAAVVLNWFRNGLEGTLYWVGAWFAAEVIGFGIAWLEMRREVRRSGVTIWDTEWQLHLAYRLHAERIGITTDYSPEEGEVRDGKWGTCLMNYAIKCPTAVVRSAEMVEALAAFVRLPAALLGMWATARADRTTAASAKAFAALLLLHGEWATTDDHDDEDQHDEKDEDDAASVSVGGWPHEGLRRVWVPDARCSAAFTAVALPQTQGFLNRDIYLSLLADRLAWAARRDEWDVDELRVTAMRYVPRFGETGELDDVEDLRKLIFRIVNSLPVYHALERAGAFDKPMQINLGVADEEDVIGETNISDWLAELSTTHDDD